MSFRPGDLVVLMDSHAPQGAWLWENTGGFHLAQAKWESGVIGEKKHDRFIKFYFLIGEKLCYLTTGQREYGFEPIFEKYAEPKE